MLFFRRVQSYLRVRFLKLFIYFRHRHVQKNDVFSHVTYYAVGNAGDTVLSECVRKTFCQMYKPLSWSLLSVNRTVTNNMIDGINQTKALLIGGGGLFLPDTNKNLVSGWQWACNQKQLKSIHVPIIVFSVGYNYFRGQTPDSFFIKNLQLLVEKADFIGLRNRGSVRAVQALLPSTLQEKIVYQPCTTTLIKKICPDMPPKQETHKVAFNLAFDRTEMRFGNKKDCILTEISNSITTIRDKGYHVYIVAHCTPDLQILPFIKNRRNIKIVNAASWGFHKLVHFYYEMDVVLGMRGHAQMIPFGLNCHIISLGSHEKMRWFLEDIDAEDWYVEITESPHLLSNRIVQKFEVIHEKDSKETTRRLIEAQNRLYKITCNNMNVIKTILKGEKV